MNTRPKILIVDDDEGHALLIHQYLAETGLGNSIAHFRDGQSVLDFFFDRTVSKLNAARVSYLLLLDIRMPGVDGIEVLRRLKDDPESKSIAVIMLSTCEAEPAIEQCYGLGCAAYVTKPVDYGRFSSAIQILGNFMSSLLMPEIAEREFLTAHTKTAP